MFVLQPIISFHNATYHIKQTRHKIVRVRCCTPASRYSSCASLGLRPGEGQIGGAASAIVWQQPRVVGMTLDQVIMSRAGEHTQCPFGAEFGERFVHVWCCLLFDGMTRSDLLAALVHSARTWREPTVIRRLPANGIHRSVSLRYRRSPLPTPPLAIPLASSLSTPCKY